MQCAWETFIPSTSTTTTSISEWRWKVANALYSSPQSQLQFVEHQQAIISPSNNMQQVENNELSVYLGSDSEDYGEEQTQVDNTSTYVSTKSGV